MRTTLFWVIMRRIGPVFLDFRALKMGPIAYPETSIRNYHLWFVVNQKSAILMYLAAEAGNFE
jgi:hypothetical protein